MNFKHWSWHFEKKIRKSTLQEWCLLPTYLSKKTFFQSFRLRWKSFWRRCANERVKLNFFSTAKNTLIRFSLERRSRKFFDTILARFGQENYKLMRKTDNYFLPKLTAFVFDFAGLRVVRILSKVHGTSHVVINPKTDKIIIICQTIINEKW